jgi:hypothetical protein
MLTACGGRPDTISEEMYNHAESAIKAADAYMDNKMSYDDAYEKLDGLADSAKRYSAKSSEYTKNNTTYYMIGNLRSSVALEHRGSETYAELVKMRNDLAEMINYSLRD